MPHFNRQANAVVCGTITAYDGLEDFQGRDRLPELLNLFLYRYITIQGFSILDHLGSFPEFLVEATPWVVEGKIRSREDIVSGFEVIPETFLRLFEGSNNGKLIVKID